MTDPLHSQPASPDASAKPLDLLVVGGGVVGCMVAVEAVRRGLSVAVIEKRAYLGREISAYNHTFVGSDPDDGAFRKCPEPFKRLFRLHGNQEIVAPEGLTRQHLMAILEEHDIPVLFEAEPVAASVTEAGVNGLVLSCPIGLGWIPGTMILDATENRNLLRLLADRPYLDGEQAVIHAVFEMGLSAKSELMTSSSRPEILSVAETGLGLLPGSIQLHPCLRNDTAVIEYGYETVIASESWGARSLLESQTRQKSVDVASWLRGNVQAFADSRMGHMAYECHIAQGETAALACDYANVFSVDPLPWGFSLNDIVSTASSIRALLADFPDTPSAEVLPTGMMVGRGVRTPMSELSIERCADDGIRVPVFIVSGLEALNPGPVLTSDVCVAGVGAGGGMAMLGAAERGCRVIALEVNRDLGGTHTTGRVIGYYAGYRGGANAVVETDAAQTRPDCIPRSPGGMSHAEYLRRRGEELGIQVLTGTQVCGVCLENGVVKRILAANEDGLFAIDSKVTIDTTGDGDVAALAGVPYSIGDDHDGMVQSYSMWGTEVCPTSSFLAQRYLTDPGLFHPDVYSERIRAIAVAHHDNSPSHISPMLTPRESRRIVGEHALTMSDILSQRVFDDVLAVACTQTDSHAFASSDFDRLGGAGGGKHLQVRIPYGCFIPKGIEGLLVAAKAISGERDATCFCRMNADVKNAGYAVGVAAAVAAKAGSGVRDIDLVGVQRELKQIGVLPDWAFRSEADEDAEDPIAQLGDGGFAALTRVLYLPTEQAVPQLEKCFAELRDEEVIDSIRPFTSEKSLVSLALAWHGSAVGGDHLAQLLQRAVSEGRHLTLPHLTAFRLSPRRGGEGEDDYTMVNRLLVMAGRSGLQAVVASLAQLIADTPGLGKVIPRTMPYDANRRDIVSEPFYHRLRNIAFAVERKADLSLVSAMDTLLQRDGIMGHSVAMDIHAPPKYMLAHLEIWVARAAARCGSRLGAEVLVRYLSDTHVFFRRHARQELSLIAGGDQGGVADWQRWLNQEPTWQAVPLAR